MNPARTLSLLCSAGVVLALGACAPQPELLTPEVLVSPYDSVQGDALWAVAPLRNESGTSAIDVLAMTDTVIGKIQETRGLSAVSTNRVLGAMRALGMQSVRTPGEARQLAAALGVDAIVVGTITAYDPYDPPTIGLTLGLYGSGTGAGAAPAALDARQVAASPTEVSPSRFTSKPLAVVSEHFDARNHEVLMDLRRFATGRTEQHTALDWRGYTANSQLFAQFAAHQSIGRLLDAERLRLARSATKQAASAR